MGIDTAINGIYVKAHAAVFINDVVVHELLINENVVSIETHNDAYHIGASCDIVLPQNARITYQNNLDQAATPDNPNPVINLSNVNNGFITAPVRSLFNTGDHIKIFAKYDDYESDPNAVALPNAKTFLQSQDKYLPIFNGFVFDFYESTPLKIKCLDYIYWFNIGIYGEKINKQIGGLALPGTATGNGVCFKKVQFKTLIQDLVDTVNYHIAAWNNDYGTVYPLAELVNTDFDLPLVDISFSQMSPAAVLEWFKRELGINISLLGNQLYINIASFTTGVVTFRTDQNIISSSLQTTNFQNLKSKATVKGSNSVFLRIKLKCNFLRTNGLKDSFEIGDENGQFREVWYYNINPSTTLVTLPNKKTVPKNHYDLAQESLIKMHQDRYTGEIETFLYPYCELFWKVQYFDIRYPERNANYVVTMLSYSLTENGFHKRIKLAYLDTQ